MTKSYADGYPPTTAAEVRAAFAYDPVHGRVLRRLLNGALKPCGTNPPNSQKSVYVMWKRVYWPMELLIWIHGHGKFPTHRIMRLQGYKTHLSNLTERLPVQTREYVKPAAYVPGSPPTPSAAMFDFTRMFSSNQPSEPS